MKPPEPRRVVKIMNRPIGFALLTLIVCLGCGGAPAPSPTTASETADPPAAKPDEAEATSGTVDDASGPAMVTQNPTKDAAPTAEALDKEGIRRVVRTGLPAVRACYEDGLTRRPELAGTVTVTFQIESTGSVSSASASGLGDTQVESCVASVVEGLRFPAGQDRGAIIVNYPFTLRPKPE